MAKVELSEQQGQYLLNCIDADIKTNGLKTAAVGLQLVQVLQAAFNGGATAGGPAPAPTAVPAAARAAAPVAAEKKKEE